MNYYVLLTDIGQAKIANAVALGQQIKLTHIAVGDANGQTPQPQSNVKALVHERYRASINRVDIDSHNANWIVLEQVLPPDTGGWEIREVGAFDADGNLIAYGNYPPTYKPMLAEGTSRTQTVRIVMQVSDTAAVTLKVDPSIVLATRQYVDEGDAKQAAALTKAINAHETSRNHPEADAAQKGFVRLATTDEALAGTQDRAAMTPKTSKAAIDALKLGDAAQMSHSMASLDNVSGHRNEVADTSQLVELRQRVSSFKEGAHRDVVGSDGPLMAQGAFGLGGAAARWPSSTLDDNTVPGGVYYIYPKDYLQGTYPPHVQPKDSYAYITVLREGDSGVSARQMFMGNCDNRVYTRVSYYDWGLKKQVFAPWVELQAGVPGQVSYMAFEQTPAGWLRCDGAEVSRSAYSALFSAIGTRFGSGDGTNTFNVPDLRGEFIRCWDNGKGVDSNRVFGSAQKGSVIAHELPQGEVRNAHSYISKGTNSDLGFDDVESAVSMFTLNADSKDISTWAPHTKHQGITRPRNIALLACIKY